MPTASVNDITLDYEQWGSADDPPVLLVMGLGSQRILWPPELIDGLVQRDLRVVAFDNRDVGRSTFLSHLPASGGDIARALNREPFDAPYALADMAADAVGLLDHLDIEQAHVVGASMGGMIGQHLAFGFPERVATLTSIMSTTGSAEVGNATAEASVALFTPPPTTRDAYIRDFVARRGALGSPGLFDAERARHVAAAVYDRGVDSAGTVRQLLAIYADRDRTDRLAQITAPTLVIHGNADPLVDVSGGRATAAAIPRAELLILDGMGHDLPLPLLPHLIDAITDHIRSAEEEAEQVA